MTRLYLWQENRRAHIEATQEMFLKKRDVIWKRWNVHKDFSSNITNEIICSVDCTVAAASVFWWVVTFFRRLCFNGYQTDLGHEVGHLELWPVNQTFAYFIRQKGWLGVNQGDHRLLRAPVAPLATYHNILCLSQVSQPAGQRIKTCSVSEKKIAFLSPQKEGKFKKEKIYALMEAQCNLHVRANIFIPQIIYFGLCVFIFCNVYISLQLFAHINKRFN